jgi:hypothetical protein
MFMDIDIFNEGCVVLPELFQVLENKAIIPRSKSAEVNTARGLREIKLAYNTTNHQNPFRTYNQLITYVDYSQQPCAQYSSVEYLHVHLSHLEDIS